MATTALTYPGAPALTRNNQPFLPLRVPQFTFEQGRWSTTRTENVEQIAEAWQNTPTLVRIFQDPKFGHMQMALLRKDQLEALIKILRDLESGQAAILYDVQTVIDAMGVVSDFADTYKKALPKGLKRPLTRIVKMIVRLGSKVSSSIQVQAPQREVALPLLSEEERPLED